MSEGSNVMAELKAMRRGQSSGGLPLRMGTWGTAAADTDRDDAKAEPALDVKSDLQPLSNLCPEDASWAVCCARGNSVVVARGAHLWRRDIDSDNTRYLVDLRRGLPLADRTILCSTESGDRVVVAEGCAENGRGSVRVRVVHVTGGTQMFEATHPTKSTLAAAAVSSQGEYVLVAVRGSNARSSVVAVWKPEKKGEPMFTGQLKGLPRNITFPSDDALHVCASGDKYLRLVRLGGSLEETRLVPPEIEKAATFTAHAFLPGKRLAAATLTGNTFIISIAERKVLQTVRAHFTISSLAPHMDGFLAGTSTGTIVRFAEYDGQGFKARESFDTQAAQEVKTVQLVGGGDSGESASAVVLVGGRGVLNVGLAPNGAGFAEGHPKVLFRFSPRADLISVCDHGGSALIYSKKSNRLELHTLRGPGALTGVPRAELQLRADNIATAVELHPSGTSALVGFEQRVVLYVPTRGKFVESARWELDDQIRGRLVLKFSNRGHLFALAKGSTMCVYDAAWRQGLLSLPTASRPREAGSPSKLAQRQVMRRGANIMGVRWSYDDQLVARSCSLGTVWAWDIRNGKYALALERVGSRCEELELDYGAKSGDGKDWVTIVRAHEAGGQQSILVARGVEGGEPSRLEIQGRHAADIVLTAMSLDVERKALAVGTRSGNVILCTWPPVLAKDDTGTLSVTAYASYPAIQGAVTSLHVCPASGLIIARGGTGRVMVARISRWMQDDEGEWDLSDLLKLRERRLRSDMDPLNLLEQDALGRFGMPAERMGRLMDPRFEVTDCSSMQALLDFKSRETLRRDEAKRANDFALSTAKKDSDRKMRMAKQQMVALLSRKDDVIMSLKSLMGERDTQAKFELQLKAKQAQERVEKLERDWLDKLEWRTDRGLKEVRSELESVRKEYGEYKSSAEARIAATEASLAERTAEVKELRSQFERSVASRQDDEDTYEEYIRQAEQEQTAVEIKFSKVAERAQSDLQLEKAKAEHERRVTANTLRENSKALTLLQGHHEEAKNELAHTKAQAAKLRAALERERERSAEARASATKNVEELARTRRNADMMVQYQAALEDQIKRLKAQHVPYKEEIKRQKDQILGMQKELIERANKEVTLKLEGVSHKDVASSRGQELKRVESRLKASEKRLKGITNSLRDIIETSPSSSWAELITSFYHETLQREPGTVVGAPSRERRAVLDELQHQRESVERVLKDKERFMKSREQFAARQMMRNLEDRQSLVEEVNGLRRDLEKSDKKIEELKGALFRVKAQARLQKRPQTPSKRRGTAERKSGGSVFESHGSLREYVGGVGGPGGTRVRLQPRVKRQVKTTRGKLAKGTTSHLGMVTELRKELSIARQTLELSRSTIDQLHMEKGQLQQALAKLSAARQSDAYPSTPNGVSQLLIPASARAPVGGASEYVGVGGATSRLHTARPSTAGTSRPSTSRSSFRTYGAASPAPADSFQKLSPNARTQQRLRSSLLNINKIPQVKGQAYGASGARTSRNLLSADKGRVTRLRPATARARGGRTFTPLGVFGSSVSSRPATARR